MKTSDYHKRAYVNKLLPDKDSNLDVQYQKLLSCQLDDRAMKGAKVIQNCFIQK